MRERRLNFCESGDGREPEPPADHQQPTGQLWQGTLQMTPRYPKESHQADLEELHPYSVRIDSFDVQAASEKYGTSLKLIYSLVDDPKQTIWDFLPFLSPTGDARLGKTSAGQVSRFRGFLNAVAGRPEGDRVLMFDDEDYRAIWPDGVELVLEPGLQLRIVGEMRARGDGDGAVYRVVKYRPAVEKVRPALPPPAKPLPEPEAAAAVALDDIPF
jgi:hypothetical protein